MTTDEKAQRIAELVVMSSPTWVSSTPEERADEMIALVASIKEKLAPSPAQGTGGARVVQRQRSDEGGSWMSR